MNDPLWFSVILLGFVIFQNTNSQSCPVDQCGRYSNFSGDVLRLGVVANIHRASQNGQQCSQIVKRNVEMAEAIRWVFNHLNSRNFIPGVALNTVVLDACSRDDVAVHELVSVFPNFRQPSCQQAVHGVVGLTSSSQSQSLAKSLGKMGIPIISPTSSAPSLSDTTNYPSLFRTIPSAINEVKVMFNIVKELGMQYVAVVHSDDAYGTESAQEFERLTTNTVCIGGKFSVRDTDLIYKLIRLQENLQENLPNTIRNLPVVYIGNYEGAESLILAANRYLLNKASQRFLWIFSSTLGIESEIFTRHTKIGRNVVSVSHNSIKVQEFTDYWSETLVKYLSSNTSLSHQWYYQEYIYESLSCSSRAACVQRNVNSVNQNYKQSAFLNMALDTAYIYAYAFKDMHSRLCRGQQGLCSTMQQSLTSSGDLTDAISNSRFLYDDNTFPFLPTYLQNSTKTIQFSGSDLAITSPSYAIQNTRCDQRTGLCNFVQVGNMTGDNFALRKQDIRFYLTPETDETTRADTLLPIHCRTNCDVCVSITSQGLPFASIWGEFLIVSFFSATQAGSDAFGCSNEVSITESVDLLEAMLYAVDAFNGIYNHSNEIFVNGRPRLAGKLGIIAFNDCHNPLYAGQLLSNWLTKIIKLRDSAGRLYNPDKCVAVIGGSYSSINLRLLPITKAENLLQLSATATSVQLEFGGSFLRTIPADDVQVQVMVDFVKHLGSNAVSVVYLDDSYGINGYEELKKRAYEAELCVSVAVKIPVNIQENSVHDVLDRLRLGRPTRIVILFATWREAFTILRVANTRARKKEFVWIGTESWGKRPVMLSDDTDPEVLGSFTVLVQTEPSAQFGEYLATRDPETNTRNPFFRPWWEKLHQCILPTKNTPNPLNKCPSGLSLRYRPEDLYADLVRKAVWSIGIGLSTTVDKLCRSSQQFCSALRTRNGLQELVWNVKKVEMTVFGERRRLYTDRGDGNVDEDILNVQVQANNRIYKQVARLHRSHGFNITANYTFYDEDGRPVPVPYSTCTTCNCIFKHKDDPLIHLSKYIRTKGDMYIAAVLPVHASTRSYGISLDGIVSLEALLAAVELTNRNMQQKMGLIIYDGYGSRDLTDWHIVSLVNSGKYLGLGQYNINDSMIVAFLTNSEHNSLMTRETVTNKDIIHFDLGKSWSATSNNANYYFSLGFAIRSELSAIVSFLIYHGWSKVQLLCSATADSKEVCQLIQVMFRKHGICTSRIQTLEKSTYQISADNVILEVASSRTNVVVSLSEEEDVAPFMDALGATIVRKPVPYPVFIGWSRFTKGVSQLSGTYKDIYNNSVGFQETLLTLSDAGKQVLQTIKTVTEDPQRNPWFTRDLAHDLQNKDLTSQYRVIEDTVEAANILAKAMQDLLSAECNNQDGLCDELLQLPDWRKRLFKNVNNGFKRVAEEKTVFDIVTYITDDVPNAPYRIKKIGNYDADSGKTYFGSEYILHNVLSGCGDNQCDMTLCKIDDTSDPFSAWGIAFLVIVPLLLIIIAILLAFIIKDICRRRRDIKETYMFPGSLPPREHVKPPPLPSRGSQQRISHGMQSLYSPGASEASATSFVSASSHPSDNRSSSSTIGMPRQPFGSPYQDGPPRGVAYRDPHVLRTDRDGSYLNPAFTQPEEPSQTQYSMSLSVLPPENAADKPLTYGQLQFENSDPYGDLANRGTTQNRPSVHASGPITPTGASNSGFVSSV